MKSSPYSNINDRYIGKIIFPKDYSLGSQVGRKNHNIKLISDDIIQKLDIQKSDYVLDICSGNGLITCEISKRCYFVDAVDFSEYLTGVAKSLAKSRNIHNIKHYLLDALNLDSIFINHFFDKAYCYYSFQRFNPLEGEKIIRMALSLLRPGGSLFIGDIPERGRIFNYYKTFKQRLFLLKEFVLRKFNGKGYDRNGWWYTKKDMVDICRKIGVDCFILKQHNGLPNHYYRFDCIIKNLVHKHMTNLKLRLLTEEKYHLWDNFVSNSKNGTIFHTSKWLKAFMKEFKILVCFKNDVVVAGFPFFIKRKFNISYVSLYPLTLYSGIVFYKNTKQRYCDVLSEQKQVQKLYAEYFKKKYAYVCIRLTPDIVDAQHFIWSGYDVDLGYTYLLRINDIKETWYNMDRPRKRNIQSAINNGINVMECNDFDRLFRLVEQTYLRKNRVPYFREYAYSIIKSPFLVDNYKSFVVVDKSGNHIAAEFIVYDNKRAYALLGGLSSDVIHHGAKSLAVWDAIKYAHKELNLLEFDFAGSMVPEVERFARKFGGELKPVYKLTFISPYLKPFIFIYGVLSKMIGKR